MYVGLLLCIFLCFMGVCRFFYIHLYCLVGCLNMIVIDTCCFGCLMGMGWVVDHAQYDSNNSDDNNISIVVVAVVIIIIS